MKMDVLAVLTIAVGGVILHVIKLVSQHVIICVFKHVWDLVQHSYILKLL